jgi:stage V sporulation protein SpoVS
MLPLSVALVAKSLDGDVGTQTKEEENKIAGPTSKNATSATAAAIAAATHTSQGIDLSMVPALVRHLYEDQSPLLDQ